MLALPAAGLVTAAVASGCSTTLPTSAIKPPADLPSARAAARTETELIARYDAAIASHPSLAGLLTGLRAHHTQHLAALVALVPALSTAGPSAAATRAVASGAAPTPGGTAPPADDSPAARASALAALAAAERTAAGAHRATSLATTAELAPLLASLYAAESCHADLLGLGAAS